MTESFTSIAKDLKNHVCSAIIHSGKGVRVFCKTNVTTKEVTFEVEVLRTEEVKPFDTLAKALQYAVDNKKTSGWT